MPYIGSGEQVPGLGPAPLDRQGVAVTSSDHRAAQSDLSPDPDTLQTLRDLCARYGLVRASGIGPRTISEAHRAEHGHYLRPGCCRLRARAA